MNKMYACPCCGEVTLEEVGGYDICGVCDWEDDPLQRDDPDDDLGANTMSLNEAKAAWESKKQSA